MATEKIMDSNSVDPNVAEKVRAWRFAQRELERLRLQCADAVNIERSAENDLAKLLLPRDAKEGEKFCVWFGDSLLEVEAKDLDSRSNTVRVRTRGTTLGRL